MIAMAWRMNRLHQRCYSAAMTRAFSLLTAVAFTLSLGGCIVHERGHGRRHSEVSRKRCNPSRNSGAAKTRAAREKYVR